jgi:hypothetical protein
LQLPVTVRREAQFAIYASEGMTEKDVTPNRPYVGEGNVAVKLFVKSFLGGDNLIYRGVYGNCFKRAESKGHGACEKPRPQLFSYLFCHSAILFQSVMAVNMRWFDKIRY